MEESCEALLLERESRQESLWGGNYRPGVGEGECIEYTSLINIRPSQGNYGMSVQDPDIRRKIASIVHDLLGRGEPLP